jgi:hypothetical protein
MNQFTYKGKLISVFNAGQKEMIQALINNQIQPLVISGDRLEIQHGGGLYIFQVNHIGINEVTEHIRIIGSEMFFNILEDGTRELISSKPIQFDIPEIYFSAYAAMPSLAGTGILKTIFMHALNALAARLPQLGGDGNGWGIELFQSDGTFKQPVFYYNKPAEGSLVLTPIEAGEYRFFVDGNELLKQSIDAATGEPVMEPANEASGLAPGFHEVRVTSSDGLITETRHLFV